MFSFPPSPIGIPTSYKLFCIRTLHIIYIYIYIYIYINAYIFRETEQQILTSTDSIIAHLEDHMVKTHNMRGSPYFKAFEGKHMCFIEVMIVRKF